MKARYTVDVEMKDGFSPMTERTVESAIWDGDPTFGSIRSVFVRRGDLKDELSVFAADLFAYAEWKAGKWVLLDYFNTHKKAENAAARAMLNTKTALGKETEFGVFQFNPQTSAWEKC